MIRKTFACLLLAGLTSAAVWGQTADEIIDKHLQAIGGKDKLKAVQTQRFSGKMVMGQGMEAPFTMEMSRPNKMRMEFTIQGMTGVQAFDGKTSWSLMPFLGKNEAEAAPAEETAKMAEQSDMDGLLLDYKEHGRTVEYAGKEDLEGTPAHKLKVTQKSGDVAYVYIDTEQYLQLKQTSKSTVRGQEVESEMTFGDFKKVDGILVPHSIEQKAKGMPAGMVMTITKVEINPDVADGRFTMPAAEKKESPAPPKPPAQ